MYKIINNKVSSLASLINILYTGVVCLISYIIIMSIDINCIF